MCASIELEVKDSSMDVPIVEDNVRCTVLPEKEYMANLVVEICEVLLSLAAAEMERSKAHLFSLLLLSELQF